MRVYKSLTNMYGEICDIDDLRLPKPNYDRSSQCVPSGSHSLKGRLEVLAVSFSVSCGFFFSYWLKHLAESLRYF